MGYDEVTRHLLGLPGATLSIRWGDDHVFKIGGKMFAALGPKERKPHSISFKTDDVGFHVLTRVRGITPARYLARAQVSMDKLGRLTDKQLKAYLSKAHALVAAKLPRKVQSSLGLAKINDDI